MSDILRRANLVRREIFEPTNKAHVESFKVFLATGNWGDVQFYPEVPFTEAPATVMTKYARHTLKVTAESVMEKAERLKARGIVQAPPPETDEQRAAKMARANELVMASIALAAAR